MNTPAVVLVRWVARATGRDLVRHLLPQWTVLFLVVVELDVIVDFREVARVATSLPPAAAGLTVALLCAVSSIGARGFVADVWLGPRHAVLRRQPLGGVTWGPASVVVVGPVAAPVGACALFWYGGTALPAAATWLGLALLPTVLAAGRSGFGWLAACGVAGIVAALGQAWPASYLGWSVAVWAVAVPLSGVATVRGVSWPSAATGRSPSRPRSVLGALVHRDALAIWRRERRIVVASVLAAIPAGFVARAMTENGQYPGRTLTNGTLIGLAFVAPLTLQAATVVARHLGRRFDPPEWPVTAVQRTLALTLVAAGTLMPGWAAAAVAAPPIGVGGHLRIAGFVGALAAGAAWWVICRPGRPNPGTWPYWIGLCLAPVLSPWGAPAATLLAAVTFAVASRRLDRTRGRP